MREQGIGQNAASSASALTGMSELVCGRGNSFLSVSGSPAQRSRVQVNPNMNSAQSDSSGKDATGDNRTATCIFPPISKFGLQVRLRNRKIIFLILSLNICFGYSKEPSLLSTQTDFKLMDKKISIAVC